MEGYKPRIADQLLADLLDACGCVLLEGSKWCGKTTTAEQLAKSVAYMADPEEGPRNVQYAQSTPKFLLQGETPRLIDEWQVVPTLWDAIRGEVDHRRALGQFIITGSAVPADKENCAYRHWTYCSACNAPDEPLGIRRKFRRSKSGRTIQ